MQHCNKKLLGLVSRQSLTGLFLQAGINYYQHRESEPLHSNLTTKCKGVDSLERQALFKAVKQFYMMDKFIVHNHYYGNQQKDIAAINRKLDFLISKSKQQMDTLKELQDAVTKNSSVEASAIELLNGLKAKLDAAGTDPVALKALSDQLGSNTAALAAAVVANTPAAPAAPVTP